LKTQLTVYELPSSLFDRCKPLYAQAWFDAPVYDAVFEGRQPGRIFVDDAEKPSAAILFHSYDYHIGGTPDSPLRKFIKDAPEEANIFQKLYGYVPIGEAWTAALLEDISLMVIPRQNFQWQAGVPAPNFAVPDGGRIERVDLTLAQQIDRELFLPFLQMFWGSHEALIENGFAYCALYGDSVASVIYAVAMSSTGVVVGIDTVERFQRQGYGAAVSAAFIREALTRGLQIFWDTDLENTRSSALARKLGFVEHEPFKQLRPPDGKPNLSRSLWSQGETRMDGVIEWIKR
jgi:RimJ/RimL family protein N-acetyltransferase